MYFLLVFIVPCNLNWPNICIDQTYTLVLSGQKTQSEDGEIYLIISVEIEGGSQDISVANLSMS